MTEPIVSNVLKSNAVVWKAPIGTALPDPNTVAAGAAWGDGWTRVGFTKSPLTLAYEAETANIEVEEYLMPINRKRVSESASLEVVLAEFTAEYLALGLGGEVVTTPADATAVGLEELEVGNESKMGIELWGFEGVRYDDDDNALPVRFFVYRATSKLNGELEFTQKGDDYTGIPLQIEALADPTKNGKWGKLERVTAPKTV